jgi:hypothetical protein
MVNSHTASGSGNYFAPYNTFGARHLLLPPPFFAVAFALAFRHLKAATPLPRAAEFAAESHPKYTLTHPGSRSGEAIMLSEENGGIYQAQIKVRKLNGLFFMAQQEGSKMWSFQKSELPEPSLLKPS